MVRRVCHLFILLAALCILATLPANAQGVHYHDIALTTAGAGTYLQTLGSNAIIHVCPVSDVAIPCTTLSAIYSDKALTMPITQSANAFHADAFGNVDFWTTPTTVYSITITGQGTSGYRTVWDAPIGTISVLALAQTQLTTKGDLLTVNGTPALTRFAAPGSTDFIMYGDTNGPSWKAIGNCLNAVTWATATHSWGCNSSIGTGTVTSVALSVPSWLTVANSPVTSSGTLTVTGTAAQTADTFVATPCGGAGAVALRVICVQDFNAGVNADSSHYLRGDGIWSNRLDGDLIAVNLISTGYITTNYLITTGNIDTNFVNAVGFATRTGNGGAFDGHNFNLHWDGTNMHIYVDSTDLGSVCFIGANNGTC